jgi:tagatose 1,6-diphosphate aldolase
MKNVSNVQGVIAAAAMDQRGSLKKALGTRATDEGLTEFKSYVTEVLTQHASAILLDPEWGLEPAKHRAKGSGLLLAYEKTGYDTKVSGRLPDLLDVWSVRRLKEAGADCIKILLYYSTYDDAKVNSHKQAWTERIGDECRANDIPFFLELIGYKDGLEDKGPDYAALKPGVVAESMREFSKDRSAVCGRCKVVQRPEGLHQDRSAGALPHCSRRHQQAVHLPVGGCQQCGVHRRPGVRQRSRRKVQRRAVRARDLERRHSDLR